MQEFSNSQLWKSKGYLPHYHATEKYQMITYRLSDSLSQSLLRKLKSEYQEEELEKERRKYIEENLDKGYGSCILKVDSLAEVVVENWRYFAGKRYELIAFILMPNHVHVLINVFPNQSISEIVHSWKSFSSNRIKEISRTLDLKVPEKIWQKEYWDRFIRDENHFAKAIEYIHENPVKAGLVNSASEWKASSAYVSKGVAG